MRNNRNNSATKRNKKKTLGVIVAAALASVLLCVGIGSMTAGFTDFDLIKRNENNLVDVDVFEEKIKHDCGVTVKADEDGVLTLSGENKTATLAVIDLATIKLPAGEYTFTTGKNGENDDTHQTTYYMGLFDGTNTHRADTGRTLVVKAETEYTITLCVNPDESVDGVKLYPSIVDGDDAEKFYGTAVEDKE